MSEQIAESLADEEPSLSGAPSHRRTSKVAIVGAGAVGSTMAYATLMRGAARTVALFDINKAKVEAEALDLGHGIQFMSMAEVVGSDDIAVCADADVVVFTAGAKQKPGQTRLDLAEATIGLVRKVLPSLVEVAPNAVYVMVTNPVDVVTYASLKISGLPPTQLFGSGTVLDSSRLRYLIAKHTGVAVQNVHAYIAGEHGDSELPLWSSASIGAIPLLEWQGIEGEGPLTSAVRDEIAREVVESAYRIIEGKGATNYAVALAGSRIIEAILKDERRVLPVSSLLTGYYGIDDVCLSVPSIVGSPGVLDRLPVPMSVDELSGLRSSAQAVRDVARRFGF
ncbi:L-lactate dehydrogenase [Cellulomonas sp. CW35]|uniref:L-lactate dehydrogenase n=1 Tax=Cellulomonas uda TaxID=1714 RepID=A0A4Y3K887_CELUD|nr:MULTISPECIES: L-lactate dehydrogenase [Cellulomonas]ASR54312.1 L-lactate dehydrogenase [Cellulomonas sp. PSBB021]NII67166.1 L-lactate dehydrogenase [Cellulomonas uda]GEA80157.1 L-lactate dehydrogenase [Cellulomonas uda]